MSRTSIPALAVLVLLAGLSAAPAQAQPQAQPGAGHYVVTVDFAAAPENFERFKQLMTENAKASVADEPGCRQFDIYEVAAAPNHLFLYEVYDDEAAFRRHLEAPHYKHYSAAWAPLLTSRANAHGTSLAAYRKTP